MSEILAVTSQVVYGHVGGQAAVPALQRLGHEVWHLPTVLFSNHPAYGAFAGEAFGADDLDVLIRQLEALGLLRRCEAVLSGYLGAPETAFLLADELERLRGRGQVLRYCCDPIIGDDGRRYVADGLVEAFRDRLLPMADIATPNRFELELLTGRSITDVSSAVAAAQELRQCGSAVVVCTSAAMSDDAITNIAVSESGVLATDTPARREAPFGTGDLFSAVFFGCCLNAMSTGAALAHATGAVEAAIEASLAVGSRELDVIGAQDAVVKPPTLPPVRELG